MTSSHVGEHHWTNIFPPPSFRGTFEASSAASPTAPHLDFAAAACNARAPWRMVDTGDHSISNWWFQPIWKILVSWDDYSQYGKNVPNHQPDMDMKFAVVVDCCSNSPRTFICRVSSKMKKVFVWSDSMIPLRPLYIYIHYMYMYMYACVHMHIKLCMYIYMCMYM